MKGKFMDSGSEAVHVYREFEIDELLFQIRRYGVRLKVSPLVFDLVVHLLKNQNRIVTKEELRHVVWHGLKVSDGAIDQAIHKARRLFVSRASASSPIRTERGRGYRFSDDRCMQAFSQTRHPSGAE